MITLFKRQVSGWCFHCAKLLSVFNHTLDTSDVADPKSSYACGLKKTKKLFVHLRAQVDVH
jgi:hypothetical protein